MTGLHLKQHVRQAKGGRGRGPWGQVWKVRPSRPGKASPVAQRWWALKEAVGTIQWYHFTAWVPKNSSRKFQTFTVQGRVDGMAGGAMLPSTSPGVQGAGGAQA